MACFMEPDLFWYCMGVIAVTALKWWGGTSGETKSPEGGTGHCISLPERLTEIGREEGVEPTATEIWFADEARVGEKNKVSRLWAKRPHAPERAEGPTQRHRPTSSPRFVPRTARARHRRPVLRRLEQAHQSALACRSAYAIGPIGRDQRIRYELYQTRFSRRIIPEGANPPMSPTVRMVNMSLHKVPTLFMAFFFLSEEANFHPTSIAIGERRLRGLSDRLMRVLSRLLLRKPCSWRAHNPISALPCAKSAACPSLADLVRALFLEQLAASVSPLQPYHAVVARAGQEPHRP